jgi:2-polyprenyl-6-methoxyphenol hydroxylase-like FAD-dependent oxidoreductase
MYDVIVIGARCAGSPTAMLLARRGYRVLLVDRSAFPSDMPLSTHLIWPQGTALLKRWGLLDSVAASGCPPLTTARFDVGPFALEGRFPPVDGISEAYSPRRTVLDRILVEAAVAAGAELRDGSAIDELIWEAGRVSGVRGRDQNGASFSEKADIVIGADGTHSLVARLAGASEREPLAPQQGTYFTYWSGVAMEGVQVFPRAYRAAYCWQTNDDLTLVGVNWGIADFGQVRGDIDAQYALVLDQSAPELAERVRAGKREARWIGGSVPSFFRQAYGPGWALVGDASHQQDPCTAQGISDAFRDAQLLADALDAGLSERQPMEAALEDYQRRRDDAAMAMHAFTCQLAPFAPPSPEQQQLFVALRTNPAQIDRFLGAFAGSVPIPEFFAPDNLARIVDSAQ